ncbi:MAG: hypothetical protein AB1813_11065 [Verrucomicrobiota bacterium]
MIIGKPTFSGRTHGHALAAEIRSAALVSRSNFPTTKRIMIVLKHPEPIELLQISLGTDDMRMHRRECRMKF